MSGHSKWTQIKRQKGAADVKRGSLFTKHAKLIALAARHGGDPAMNPSLRTVIDKARADNMPMANIERAIRRGTGEDKSASQIEEILYEGYGPGGAALLVQALTDNKNRTVADIRHIFSSHGGNLGESGSVAWMFGERGVIVAAGGEEVELAAIDAGAEDVEMSDGETTVYTAHSDLAKVKKSLEGAGIPIRSAELSLLPKDTVHIADAGQAKQLITLMETLEDHDDVVNVASNFDISEEIMKSVT